MSLSSKKQPKRWLRCKPDAAIFAGAVVGRIDGVVGVAHAAFASSYKSQSGLER